MYEMLTDLRKQVAELRASTNALIHESRLVRYAWKNLIPPISGDLSSMFSEDESK